MTPKQAYELAQLFSSRRAVISALITNSQDKLAQIREYTGPDIEVQRATAVGKLDMQEARLEELDIIESQLKSILGLDDGQE